jgi:predicted dehydrogenase
MTALRLGMVGGAGARSIGPTHRAAARLDGHFALVAGAFSRDAAANRAVGADLGVVAERIYPDFAAMARAEAARPDRIDAVAIVTTNETHHAACSAFLDQRIPVICDKPLAPSLAEARDLLGRSARSGLPFAVTYPFAAFPIVREARRRVREGLLGRVRLIEVEYLSGWMTSRVEASDGRAAWRNDPARSGPAGVLADLGTHAFHLATFVSAQRAESALAELTSFVPGRPLDDDARIWLRLAGGAKAALRVSYVAAGLDMQLRVRVHGDQGGLEWNYATPDRLHFAAAGEPTQILTRGAVPDGPAARARTRLGGTHTEGLIAAFADIYAEFAASLRERRAMSGDFADVRAGAEGVAFIEAALASHRAGQRWTALAAIE